MPLLRTLNQYNKTMTVSYNKKYKNIIIKPFNIRVIQAVPFILLAKKRDHEIFIVIIKDIKKALKLK